MPNWKRPQKPIDHVEESLVTAILDGVYAAGDTLPGERDLAGQLGVTRPTLREALRRLERDGWVTIQQGKSTRINDFWREGGPNILAAVVRYGEHLPPGFITKLLEVRRALAPAYVGAAVAGNGPEVAEVAAEGARLPDTAAAYAAFDWHLHHTLTLLSGNAVYTLILNGFAGFYEEVAARYFARAKARAFSRRFYRRLAEAAAGGDAAAAEQLTRGVMEASIELWQGAKQKR